MYSGSVLVMVGIRKNKNDIRCEISFLFIFAQYAHGESNPNRRNRNPKFYPLNYGCLYYLCGLMMQK